MSSPRHGPRHRGDSTTRTGPHAATGDPDAPTGPIEIDPRPTGRHRGGGEDDPGHGDPPTAPDGGHPDTAHADAEQADAPGPAGPEHVHPTDTPTLTGHGHGHGHGPAPHADRRVRIAIAALLVPAAVATLVGLVLLFPFVRAEALDGAAALPRVTGTVAATAQSDCSPGEGDRGCAALTVRLTGGDAAGTSIVTLVSVVRGVSPFTTGDEVTLSVDGDIADPESYQIVDFQREVPLLVLALLFAAAVIALGRFRGLAALGSLVVTGVVLVGFVLPAILAGRDPLLVAVVGCTAIMFCALYLTHGFSSRTSTAVLGTFGSLVLIGVLGVAFAAASRLTGADEDTASLANTLGTAVDGRGLVLAGLMIGALGALDDVTVTQTSAVWELRAADPALRPAALFSAAMRIGRDHVASAVNTLVLAYAGAALPLLLLFSVAERGLADTLTSQVIATEVVRTLVGSIGLVAAVPLTTALAVVVSTRGRIGR
ncbi:YibE/F family protein [Pseudonocardia abyssalis]|uniref:YibE/F family protein n=2 Tax=Pseudonocardia abyssalis TaxID=2792008 RepID=UPI001C4A2D4A|nr:YibE/F family protein [Pseudonocardia abyssalis]